MKRVAALLAVAAALLLAACAGAPPGAPPLGDETVPPPGSAPFANVATRFTARALSHETAGDLRRALDSWKIVAALQPEEAEPKRRIADLTARLKSEAERRFRDGNARLQEGSFDAARREFLLSLAADPDHAGALNALKTRFEQDATPYTVRAGDSFAGIAKKQYGDAAKSALVARANNLDPAGKPVPGTVLTLPDLLPLAAKSALKRRPEAGADTPEALDSTYETESGEVRNPAEALLTKAQELFQAKKFEEAGSAADQLAGNPALAARARQLSGDAWFAAGAAALKLDRFAEAVAAYRKAEPARKDITAALAAVERRKTEKAEELYNEGVRFFINQQLDQAIRSWEQTLALNPEHPKAPKNIEKARGLQQKLKELR